MNSPSDNPFSLSFVGASLRPELVQIVAEAYLKTGSWEAAKAQVLATNALQARRAQSAIRVERELRQRLMRLTAAEIRLAATGMLEERTAVAWLAALKSSSYIHAFASEVLRGKLSSLDPVLRQSDYEAFFADQSAIHPDLLALTSSSRAKVRSRLLALVREAGIGLRQGQQIRIQRPMVPPSVHQAILADSPCWLAGFLVPDSEIPA